MGFLMVCFNPWDFFKYPTPRCSTFHGLAKYIILTMDIAWETTKEKKLNLLMCIFCCERKHHNVRI